MVTSSNKDQGRVFHLFPDLPSEIRLKIWEEARPEPRVIKIDRDTFEHDGYTFGTPRCSAKVPSLLHVNFESRHVALEWYTLPFEKLPSQPAYIYFDCSRDWAYLSCDACKGRTCNRISNMGGPVSCGLTFSFVFPWRKILKRFVCQFDDDEDFLGANLWFFWLTFECAEEAMLVNSRKAMDSQWEGNLSDFKNVDKIYRVNGSSKNLLEMYQQYTRNMPINLSIPPRVLKKLSFVEFEPSLDTVIEGQAAADDGIQPASTIPDEVAVEVERTGQD
ncbi:uncharacterized protein LY89DRAFT_718399 [Mollisia scopiformis]|uniref:2EXR domain-containing protein n=1 Tax=Mollisia scopiformis TaxID=149040 RepID=A0A194XC91_MOLSC|nr:uncharacterized protein LY89DRAFT_718399 [Mollisia scopiformis]KUJ17776.1 hypothetical protein LY89DRAFT_718399 [Mollisia scopiformis]